MGASERFWLTHPAPREVSEAHRKGVVLDIGCGPLKQIGTVGVDHRALPGVDVVCDFERGLPFKQSSYCRGLFNSLDRTRARPHYLHGRSLPGLYAGRPRVYQDTVLLPRAKPSLIPRMFGFRTEESFEIFQVA